MELGSGSGSPGQFIAIPGLSINHVKHPSQFCLLGLLFLKGLTVLPRVLWSHVHGNSPVSVSQVLRFHALATHFCFGGWPRIYNPPASVPQGLG